MIKAIAIDDEPLALEVIEAFSGRLDFLSLERYFTHTGDALRYLEKNSIDLLLLDINMPAVSGIEFFRSLRHQPMLILTTSHAAYALESYELNTIDYLLKPFSFARFETAVLKVKQQHELLHSAAAPGESRCLMLKADYGLVKISLSEILFIEGLDNYLKIYLENKPPLVVRYTMKALTEQLNEREFIRVHRSFIVPFGRIESVRHKIITIGNEEIPVGRNYEEPLKAWLNERGL